MRELNNEEKKEINGGWDCCLWANAYYGTEVYHMDCGRVDPYYTVLYPRINPYGYRRIG